MLGSRVFGACELFIVNSQLSVVGCPLSVVSCQLSLRTTDHWQLTPRPVNNQLSVVSCPLSVVTTDHWQLATDDSSSDTPARRQRPADTGQHRSAASMRRQLRSRACRSESRQSAWCPRTAAYTAPSPGRARHPAR